MGSEASRWEEQDLVLYVKVQAGASADEMTGDTVVEEAGPGARHAWLRVRIAAPAVDGKANKRLCRYLADCFGVSRSRVTVEKGETRPWKQIRIRQPAAVPGFITP
ncbi:MAG: DUF167 domain-containing protein [Pseudomonadales bacterium]|nr:DUF167 domain-containing protein [Pseudomonadales bacterium]